MNEKKEEKVRDEFVEFWMEKMNQKKSVVIAWIVDNTV